MTAKLLRYCLIALFVMSMLYPTVIATGEEGLFKLYSTSTNPHILSVKVSTIDGNVSTPILYGDGDVFLGNGKNGRKKLTISSTNTLEYDVSDNKRDIFLVSAYVSEGWDDDLYIRGWSRVMTAKITGKKSNPSVSIRNEITKDYVCSDIKPGKSCRIGEINLTVDKIIISDTERKIIFKISDNGKFNLLFDRTGNNFLQIPAANNQGYMIIYLWLEGRDDLRLFNATWIDKKIYVN